MKRFLLSLLTYGLIVSSCQQENLQQGHGGELTVKLSVGNLSDPNTRSEASNAEKSITGIALWALNADGVIEEVFPVIKNPQGEIAIHIANTTKSIVAIANPIQGMAGDADDLEDMKKLLADFTSAPGAPFIMSGISRVNGNVMELELKRAVAKICVKGTNGFEVTSVTVQNTPSRGFVFGDKDLSVPATTAYISYAETATDYTYVSENGTAKPTRLLVKGTYKGEATAYGITLTNNGNTIGILRNTCYQVTINPIIESKCEVSVTIPDWDDVNTDDHYIPDFGTYMAADFHQHTGFSDGRHPITFVLNQGNKYGLDGTRTPRTAEQMAYQ